jgi:hypothetical protein
MAVFFSAGKKREERQQDKCQDRGKESVQERHQWSKSLNWSRERLFPFLIPRIFLSVEEEAKTGGLFSGQQLFMFLRLVFVANKALT